MPTKEPATHRGRISEGAALCVVDGCFGDGESSAHKPQRGKMKVRFYGRLAEAIGSELEVNCASDCTVAEVRERVAAEHPDAAGVLRSKRALSFVGERLVRDDYRLASGDKLEFLPPVSGG